MREFRLPLWPKGLKRVWFDVARFTIPMTRSEYQEHAAYEVLRRQHAIQNSFVTGTCGELMWTSQSDGTANANTNTETAMFTGLADQPTTPAQYFYNKPGLYRKLTLFAAGVASTTSTPTVVGQWRMNTTQSVTSTAGTSMAQNAAFTCASGVTSARWESRLDCTCRVTGQGTGNATMSMSGYIGGPLFSSLQTLMAPSSGSPAAWTATFDANLAQYWVFNWTWGTASASNTATCKDAYMIGWN